MTFGLMSLAMRNLMLKPFRTAVLVLSIGLLVAILVFGTSFIESVSLGVARATARFGADLAIVPMGASDSAETVLLEGKGPNFYMPRDYVDKIKQVEGVAAVTSQTFLESILGVCCDIPPVKVVAIDQDTDFIVKPWLSGIVDRKMVKGEAIIGYQANQNLDLIRVSSSVLFNKKFNFIGRLIKTGTGLDNAIFISDENLPDIVKLAKTPLKAGQISMIFVKLKSGYDPYKVGRQIAGDLNDVNYIYRDDIGKGIIGTLKDINRIFLLTISIAALIAVFLTWTIFSAIVNERAREIGILRAIGARGKDVARAFLIEVVTLGSMGSVVGIIAGTLMSLGLTQMFTLIRDMNVSLTLGDRLLIALLGLAVGVGISVVGSLSSVNHIKRLEPLDVLKEQ